MTDNKALLFFHALTGVHCGSGSSLTAIDLPIQREKHTGFPVFQASSVKGTLRRFYKTGADTEAIFGPEKDGSEHAAAITITDGRILFFPVKSFKDVFALVTCPLVLERFSRDLKALGSDLAPRVPEHLQDGECVLCGGDESINRLLHNGKLIIEEYALAAKPGTHQLFSQSTPIEAELASRMVVVSNNLFTHLVTTGTEVNARVAIDKEKGTVKTGALWYEEYLPAESILYSLVIAQASRDARNKMSANEVMKRLRAGLDPVLQLGGNETIGKGMVELKWLPEASA